MPVLYKLHTLIWAESKVVITPYKNNKTTNVQTHTMKYTNVYQKF